MSILGTCPPSPAELVAHFVGRTVHRSEGLRFGKDVDDEEQEGRGQVSALSPSVPTAMTLSLLVPPKPPLEILRWIPQEGNVGNAHMFNSTKTRRGSF